MSQWRNLVKITFIGILTAFMSTVPFLFSASFVRINRLSTNAKTFWLIHFVIAAILWLVGLEPLAISFISVVILIGLFFEVQNQFKNVFVSGLASVLASFVTIVFATQQWLSHQGISLVDRIREQVQVVVNQATAMNSLVKLDVDSLILQTPSAVISLMIIAISISLITEDMLVRLFKIENLPMKTMTLTEFKLPDFFIWIAMLTFLFSFLDVNNKVVTAISMNILNTIIVLYFFQGLAVVESFFTALRFGIFIRLLTYVVLLIQLFFLVAAIGAIDFWVDFRSRFLKKKTAQ